MSVLVKQGLADDAEVHRFRTLYQLLAELSKAEALEDVYSAALASLHDATAADRAAILLYDDDGVIRFHASRGLSDEYQKAVTGHSPWARGATDTRPIVVPDIASDESLAGLRQALEREGIASLAFIPLSRNAGVFGKFMLYSAVPHEWTSAELDVAQAIASHVALAIEHKRAELARLQSEQRLQAILDNSPSVIFLKDPEGRYVLVNRRFEELFHVTKENVLGRTIDDIVPAEISERLKANDAAVLAAGKPIAFEEQAPHDDGLHTYISTKFPLEGPDGRGAGLCCIATDITERRQLESAARHLAAIVESSDDAIISKDLNGLVTSWNRAAERMFGYQPDEILGKPVAILAAPGHHDEMPEILSRIRRGERVEHFETRRRTKDGQILDVALTVSPVRDAGDRIIGASKIARDISDRKRSETELSELLSREQDARRTAELLNRVAPRLAAQLDPGKLLQEVVDIAATLIDAECGAFFENAGGESDKPREVSGAGVEAFSGLVTPLVASAVRCDDATQDPGFTIPPLLAVRSYLGVPVVARSGEVLGRLFLSHSQPGRFTAGHEAIITGIAAQTGIAMDNARLFEEARWAQMELKRSNEELRRVNRDLEVFAYSASHDLQEPLRTIAISTQLLERNRGRSAGRENASENASNDAVFLANILSAAKRMTVLIQDLLAYATATKYEEGQAPRVDAEQVLTGVLENLRGPIEEAGAAVTAGPLPVVPIHESRLAQLFQNLISNAIKYRRAGETPRIHVAADEKDGWYVFSVKDNGIGVEPQYAEQIFGLFKRLHGRDEYPGSGIGLAICQRVVEQYGGRIWLECSSPAEGATFCFALPARA